MGVLLRGSPACTLGTLTRVLDTAHLYVSKGSVAVAELPTNCLVFTATYWQTNGGITCTPSLTFSNITQSQMEAHLLHDFP